MFINSITNSLKIIKSKPKKILMIFTFSGWKKFIMLGKAKSVKSKSVVQHHNEKNYPEFNSSSWRHNDTLSKRKYDSYEQYISHQAEKLDHSGGQAYSNPDKAVNMFLKRFSMLKTIPKHASVLCLGARCGEEVKAFISLGHFCIGIDLNPGRSNQYVVCGDFHKLVFSDESVDCVYTNCLDHAFNIDAIMSEVNRVLKQNGVFVVDILYGYEEGYIPGGHDAMHWPTAIKFGQYLAEFLGYEIEEFRDLKEHGSEYWKQCIMRKK